MDKCRATVVHWRNKDGGGGSSPMVVIEKWVVGLWKLIGVYDGSKSVNCD